MTDDGPVSLLKFAASRGLLAAVSASGRMIKVWNTDNGTCIGKFKRGTTSAVILSVDFSPDLEWMVAISQNETLHFFDIRGCDGEGKSPKRSVYRMNIPGLGISYASWFEDDRIAIIGMNGRMLVMRIDRKTCQEVAREEVLFANRIIASHK
jgi:WD40 repeat protein